MTRPLDEVVLEEDQTMYDVAIPWLLGMGCWFVLTAIALWALFLAVGAGWDVITTPYYSPGHLRYQTRGQHLVDTINLATVAVASYWFADFFRPVLPQVQVRHILDPLAAAFILVSLAIFFGKKIKNIT